MNNRLLPVMQQVLNNSSYLIFKKEEDTFKAGANHIMAGACQSLSIYYAFQALQALDWNNTIFSKVLQAKFYQVAAPLVGLAIIMDAKRCMDQYAPLKEIAYIGKVYKTVYPAAVFIDSQMNKHFWLRRTVHFIHNHANTICQVAAVATAVALIYQGVLVTGIFMLSANLLDLACQKGLVNLAVRVKYYPALKLLCVGTSLVVGNHFEKAMSMVVIVTYLFSKFKSDTVLPPITGMRLEHVPTARQFHEFTLDRNHIRAADLVDDPSVNLKDAIQALKNEVKLSGALLLVKADRDDLLKTKIRDGKVQKTKEEIESYICAGLDKFVDNILNKQIMEGEPASEESYRDLLIMAKCIVKKVQQKDKMTKEDALIGIGLAGHYCGSGFFREVEGQYQAYVDLESKTLKGKMLAFLRLNRDRLYDGIVDQIFTQMYKNTLGEMTEIHTYNQVLNILGKDLGLSRERGAKADSLSESIHQALILRIYDRISLKAKNKKFVEFFHEETFFKNYTLETIQYLINQDISLSNKQGNIINLTLVQEWFESWLMEHDASLTKAQANQIFTTKIMKEYEDKNGNYFYQISENYLLLLLAELGIAKVPQNSLLLQS